MFPHFNLLIIISQFEEEITLAALSAIQATHRLLSALLRPELGFPGEPLLRLHQDLQAALEPMALAMRCYS